MEAQNNRGEAFEDAQVAFTGDIDDQFVVGGIHEFAVDGEFIHSDGDVDLAFEARLANGEPLPDFVEFDEESGTFRIDANRATAAEIDALQIVVIASDPDGNEVTTSFDIKFASGDSTDNVDDDATQIEEELLEAVDEDTESETEVEVDQDVAEDPTGDEGTNQQESADEVVQPSSVAEAAEGASTADVSSPTEDNPIVLSGNLEDQTVSEGILRYSIEDAFEHIDPDERLEITVELEDGRELPDYIIFDSENSEFVIDATQAQSLGVNEVVVKVTATDSEGNSVSSTFVVNFEEGADDATEQQSTMLLDMENVPVRDQFEAEFLQFLTGSGVGPDEGQVLADGDFGKEDLNSQIRRAGEFGYQQEKIQLKSLLKSIFG